MSIFLVTFFLEVVRLSLYIFYREKTFAYFLYPCRSHKVFFFFSFFLLEEGSHKFKRQSSFGEVQAPCPTLPKS